MKSIRQEYSAKVPVEKVWEALVDPKIIDEWGGGPAKMKEEVGFKFSLWGGDIHGTNTKVVKEKVLEQDWFGGDWDESSKLRFELSTHENKTKVLLTQSNIPDKEVDDISSGWHDYYMGPLIKLLED